MALPKGLIKQATGTVTPRRREEEPLINASATRESLRVVPEPPPLVQSISVASKPVNRVKATRTKKVRVHYTIPADLVEFASETWREYRRTDGTRLDSASDYIGELLKIARNRAQPESDHAGHVGHSDHDGQH